MSARALQMQQWPPVHVQMQQWPPVHVQGPILVSPSAACRSRPALKRPPLGSANSPWLPPSPPAWKLPELQQPPPQLPPQPPQPQQSREQQVRVRAAGAGDLVQSRCRHTTRLHQLPLMQQVHCRCACAGMFCPRPVPVVGLCLWPVPVPVLARFALCLRLRWHGLP